MDNEICNAIDKLAEKFGIAVNWGNENVVPYVQDLISRYSKSQIINLAIFSVIILACMISCIIGIVYYVRSIKRKQLIYKENDTIQDDDANEAILMPSIVGIFFFGTIFPFVFAKLMNWIFVPDMEFMKEVLKMIS